MLISDFPDTLIVTISVALVNMWKHIVLPCYLQLFESDLAVMKSLWKIHCISFDVTKSSTCKTDLWKHATCPKIKTKMTFWQFSEFVFFYEQHSPRVPPLHAFFFRAIWCVDWSVSKTGSILLLMNPSVIFSF